MIDIWERLKNETKPILLYGSGDGAEKIYNELSSQGIKIKGVFASDGFKKKRSFKGFEIIPFSKAEEIFESFIGLFAFGSNTDEVISGARKIMERQELLVAEMPVCGQKPFNLEFAKKHKDELLKVYGLLADEQSKKVFEQTLLFKLDGNIERLFDCETNEDEAFDNILKLKKGDSFLDLGAYNGDTVLGFLKRVGESSNIVAVEPDKRTFEKLKLNTGNLNIQRVNAAVSDKCDSVPFSFKASRGSVLGGEDFVSAITIDSLGSPFDFIKFDIEGEELKAIIGGINTIKQYKPKMLVSCYHRIEDYFALPLKVLEIRPDYKIYMRHYPYIPAWDTNFYFV